MFNRETVWCLTPKEVIGAALKRRAAEKAKEDRAIEDSVRKLTKALNKYLRNRYVAGEGLYIDYTVYQEKALMRVTNAFIEAGWNMSYRYQRGYGVARDYRVFRMEPM